MKIKTIKSTITKKLNDWLSSIADEKLRKDVRENLILTGGAIAAMLSQLQPNDYDLYIQDMDVCLRLAKYYASPHSIQVLDGRKREEYIEQRIKEAGKNDYYVEEIDNLSNLMVRVLDTDQVKLWIDGGGQAVNKDNDSLADYQPVFFSPNAITLKGGIQIITRFTGSPEQIHSNYDYVHATNYFTFKDGLVLNIDALTSIMTKELRYIGSKYPLTSVIRMKKFIARGYTINAGEILKMLYQVSRLDLNDMAVLHDQLIGIDIAYFSTLLNILGGKSKEGFTYQYLAAIIDRVFESSEPETFNQQNEDNNDT